jgi:hypothetical protein
MVVGLGFSGAGATPAAGAETLRAVPVGADPTEAALTIELFRWSTDAERAPLLAALAALPPAPPTAEARGRAGRGGRGGRGAPPPGPMARLTTAVKAAPTLGYIWSAGVTGYAIKYAWRWSAAGEPERIVLVIDRRLGVHAPNQYAGSGPAADAGFTLIEMRIGEAGKGEGKTSLASPVVVDTAARTLALEGYAAAPVLLEVTR